MTPRNVIAQFRRYVRDTEKTRYAEDAGVPLDYFRLALNACWNNRRHRRLFYVARIVNQEPTVRKVDDVLELDNAALDVLAHYMAYLSFQEDAEDAQNLALSQSHLVQFANG